MRANVFTAIAGFLFAARGDISISALAATIVGVALIIASACVFNNLLDRTIDAKMARTKKRALVTGKISVPAALVYGTVLGILGFTSLAIWTNMLTTALGALAFISYVLLYGYAKRKSVHGTLVGTLPGALPLVAGYTAASNQINTGALILFFVMVFWQMAHFYAIAIFRKDDYAAANIPVRSIVSGIPATRRQILYYISALTLTMPLLTIFGYADSIYVVAVLLLGASWLYKGIKNMSLHPEKWARLMFGYSLIVLIAWSLLLCVEIWLP